MHILLNFERLRGCVYALSRKILIFLCFIFDFQTYNNKLRFLNLYFKNKTDKYKFKNLY